MLIKEIDRHYVVVMQVASVVATTVVNVARFQRGKVMQYWELNYMKPTEFRGDRDLIIFLSLISDVEGFFYMCSCTENHKLKFSPNLLR